MATTPKLTSRKILIFCVMALGFWWLIRVADHWFYPWADESSGKPLLIGTWVGRLETGSGSPRGVFVELHRKHYRKRCSHCNTIEGRVLTCDPRGEERPYLAAGKTDNRSGTRFYVGISPAVDPPPDGLALSQVRGEWSGDALNLEAGFHWRKGQSAITDSADPDTKGGVPLPMRRGAEREFREICRQLRAS